MSATVLRLPHPIRRPSGFARALSALAARWHEAVKRRETRRYLSEMDEHMLHDIGISRAQALFDLDLPHNGN